MENIKLWKNGQLKELSSTMFLCIDDYHNAVYFWYSKGWNDFCSN